jgi:hypothetical protein
MDDVEFSKEVETVEKAAWFHSRREVDSPRAAEIFCKELVDGRDAEFSSNSAGDNACETIRGKRRGKK